MGHRRGRHSGKGQGGELAGQRDGKERVGDNVVAGWWVCEKAIEPLRQSPLRLPGWVAVLILIAGTAALNLVGLGWGLPNDQSWNSDSIAGMKTVRMIPRLFSSWRMADSQGNPLEDQNGQPVIERYPRGQFLITGTLYKPFLEHWENHPISVRDPRTDQVITQWYSLERISTLILVSRLVTVAMAAGAVLGVFAVVRRLCRDSLAGFLAALVLMLSGEFTYFSHLGNLDTPVTFWFVWTAYGTVRALESGQWRYFVLTGLCAGMVVCTKDPSLGHLGALAGFAVGAAVYAQGHRSGAVGVVKGLFEPRLWVAMAVFAGVFLLMNNVLTDYAAFHARMMHWLRVKEDYQAGAGQQWRLFRSAIRCLRVDCGVWMYWGLIVSLVYMLGRAVIGRSWRYGILLAWAVLPFLMFHLTITTGALQVQPRYHLPSLTALALAVGLAGSDLLRWKRIPLMVKALPMAGVFFLAGMYAVAVDAEMVDGSRKRAEQWIRENLDKTRDEITFISPHTYMPRSRNEGYHVRYTHENMTTARSLGHRPKLIGLSDKWYTDNLHFDQQFREKLLAGEMGYREIARFGPRYIPPAATGIFYLATWKTGKREVLSPTVVFMERGP